MNSRFPEKSSISGLFSFMDLVILIILGILLIIILDFVHKIASVKQLQ